MRLAALLVLRMAALSCAVSPLSVVYEWRYHDFVFPSPGHRQALISQGLFLPNASVSLDVDVHGDRMFITTPRFRPGVPATLSTVSADIRGKSPLLQPYPDWSWHKPQYCDGLTSVFRVTIDECGRLWALDTGSIDIFTTIRHVCPKQLVVFDLATDKMITRHRFPAGVFKTDSILTSVQVEVVNPRERKCRHSYAYISDTTSNALIVYDMRNDRSWRVTHNSFWPIPKWGHYQLQGSEFDLMDGVLGIALAPTEPRTLFYHSLASNTENHVATPLLQNDANFANGGNTARRHFKTLAHVRKGQSAAMDISQSGVMFYSELVDTSLKCYNTRHKYRGANNPTVAQDLNTLQFVAGLKVRKNRQGGEDVWILSDRLQKLIVGTLTDSEVNFRVLKGSVSRLVQGTDCASSHTSTRLGDDDDSSEREGNRTLPAQTDKIVFSND